MSTTPLQPSSPPTQNTVIPLNPSICGTTTCLSQPETPSTTDLLTVPSRPTVLTIYTIVPAPISPSVSLVQTTLESTIWLTTTVVYSPASIDLVLVGSMATVVETVVLSDTSTTTTPLPSLQTSNSATDDLATTAPPLDVTGASGAAEDHFDTRIIAAVVPSVLGFLVIVAIVVLVVRRWRRKRRGKERREQGDARDQDGVELGAVGGTQGASRM